MLSFFRGLTKSKFGLAIVFGFLAIIAIGFVAADLNNSQLSPTATGTAVATVGNEKIAASELGARVQRQVEFLRREQPDLTIQRFVAEGGVEGVLQQMSDGMALARFGADQGIGVSRRTEDGQIASIPTFRALNGDFDRNAFDQFLGQSGMTEAQFRADIARDAIANQLLIPVTGAARAPAALVTPYASMLLEVREGRLAFVPVTAVRSAAAPTDAEVAAFYQRNAQRYTVPERRTIRYALLSRDAIAASVQPTEAEIAKAYADNRARYAGNETRTLSQVIVADEAAARRIAAQASAGTPLAAAARSAGLDGATLTAQTRDGFAEISSPAVATAVFAAASGAVVVPGRSGLGWHVVRVDSIDRVAGRSLDQARAEIAAALKTQKADQAVADVIAKVEDGVADGQTFDEVVQANRLTAQVTPPLTADGRDPNAPAAPVAPELAVIAKAGFASEPDDDPVVEQIVPNQSFALIDLQTVAPAAPRPLAQIRDQVLRDLTIDRAMAESRRIATAIAGKVNAGTALPQALSSAGVALPAAATLGGRRQDIVQGGTRPRAELALLFSMVEKKAKVLEAPDRTGWYVVYLDRIVRGDAANRPDLIAATRVQFSPVLGQEYAEQFVAAARAAVGVTRNTAAIETLKRDLSGVTSQ